RRVPSGHYGPSEPWHPLATPASNRTCQQPHTKTAGPSSRQDRPSSFCRRDRRIADPLYDSLTS
ncbi:MAG: hypothetical protein ACF8TS_20970, partial [Maioricimonas sp. JB049]